MRKPRQKSAELPILKHDLTRSNSIVCRLEKTMYDNEVFIHRCCYQLTMFGIPLFIWLSSLLHARIAYVIDIAKMIAAFCRINYCLHNLIRLNSFNRLPCPNDKMYDDKVFTDRFRYEITMFEVCILIRISWLLHAHVAYEIVLTKITNGNWHDVGTTCHAGMQKCWETLVQTSKIDTWMSVMHAMRLGTD